MRITHPSDGTDGPLACTLLDLVQAVADSTDSEQECVAVVSAMLKAGRAVLTGNFAGRTLE
jgi:hypothetical protein